MRQVNYAAAPPARAFAALIVALALVVVFAVQGAVLFAIPHALAANAVPGPAALALLLLSVPIVQFGGLWPYWALRRRIDPTTAETRWWFGYLARRPVSALVEHLSPWLLIVGGFALMDLRPQPRDLAAWSVDERGTLALDGPVGLSAGGAFRDRAAVAGAAEGLRVVLRSDGG